MRSAADRYVFQLGDREKELLAQILGLYPATPVAHQPLSKTGGLDESSQRLLDEALAEQRKENRKRLDALLADPHRLKPAQQGWVLSLSQGELEQVLQILNDIRIGSWVNLGSPEAHVEVLDEKTAPHFWAMETAGYFQMKLLQAVDGEPGGTGLA